MVIKNQLSFTFIILLITIVIFGTSNIDIYINDLLYNFENHSWILNRDLQPWKFIFYDGIKKLLIFIGLFLLFVLIFFRNKEIIKSYKQGLIIVVLSAILVPVVTGGLKKFTNMPCPKNEIHYGGKFIKTSVWQSYPEPYKNMKHIACWPAGHASGGFALMSLFFLFKKKRNKFIALGVAITVGWVMGIYKMLIGDHFLSHTIITMLLSWFIILIIKKYTK